MKFVTACIISILIAGLGFCNKARADITQQLFSFNQVFDVQWYISSGVLYASGFNYIYASQPSNARLTSTQTNTYTSAGDVIKFFNSTTNPGTYGLGVYDSTGTTLIRVLDNTGTFTALATGAIFYNGAGMWGTLFTTSQGYSINGSAHFTITQQNPTNAQLQAYTPPTTQPLSSGQTASSPTVVSTTNSTITTTSTSGTVTSTYSQPVTITTYSDNSTTTTNNGAATLISTTDTGGSSTITTTQQSMVNSTASRMPGSGSNSIYINQTGNSDNINITQVGSGNRIDGATSTGNGPGYATAAPITGGSNHITTRQHGNNNLMDIAALGGNNTLNLNQGTDSSGNYTGLDQGGHYQFDYVNGTGNNITVVQENTTTNAGQFSSLAVVGNYNTVGITQTGTARNQLFASVSGNSNTITTTQSGTSASYLNIGASGNGNSATVSQTNTGATGANNASITLINNGAPASVNLTQTGGQNYSVTQTCATTCGTVTVRQGN
jgi:hypothetical protein